MKSLKSEKIVDIISSRIKSRLKNLFFKKKRFRMYEELFRGKKLLIHDVASFELGKNELFVNEMYIFENKSSDPYIIDCGANMGMSIIYFKSLYPNSTILAFEADKKIFEVLKTNVESYGFTGVTLENKAVWNSSELLNFVTDGGAGGRLGFEDKISSQVVHGVRLKEYLNAKKVDFLKIDIEGAEYEVLLDCKNDLKNVDRLFIEYHSMSGKPQNLHQLLDIVSQAGFRYHIKEAFTSKYPFVKIEENFGMDLQLNIFCYR